MYKEVEHKMPKNSYKMKNKNKILNNFIYCCILAIVLVFVISSFYPTLKNDDDISIGLTMHSYSRLINIASTDVHPPLYYLILKLFLQITTFWTNSMFVKIIFSRILSAIFLLGSIFVLGKICESCNLEINWKWQFLLYLLVPGMINKLVKIRMYSISSLLLALELYELLNFYKTDKNKNILFAILFTIMASYSLYSSAISAGLFLLLFYICMLIKHQRGTLKVFVSGIVLVISYLPWSPILFRQFLNHSNNDVNVMNGNLLGFLNNLLQSVTQLIFPSGLNSHISIHLFIIFISILLVILFAYIILLLFKSTKNLFKCILFIVFLDWTISIIIVWLFTGVHYEAGSTYPIFSLFIFFIVYFLVIKMNCNDLNLFNRVLAISMVAMFSIYALGGIIYNIKTFDIPSISLVKNFNQWKNIDNRNVNINTSNPLEALQNSIYLKSLHKNEVVHGVTKNDVSTCAFNDKNYSPVKKLFNNIKIENTNKSD